MKITTPIPEHLATNIDELLSVKSYCHTFNVGGRSAVSSIPTYEFIARERLGYGVISTGKRDLIKIIGMLNTGSITLETTEEIKGFAMLVKVSNYFTHHGTKKVEKQSVGQVDMKTLKTQQQRRQESE